MPMERADRAEAAYQRMEAQLEVMKQANSIMPEVKTEYAHYGNSWRNDQEAVMPDRLVMLDVLKNTIFPICKTIETVRVTDDQMDLECTGTGNDFKKPDQGDRRGWCCALCNSVSGRNRG